MLFLGAAALYKNSSSNGLPIPGPGVEATDQTRGNGKTVLMEFSDYQCPACKAYYPLVEQLVKDEGDNITFVYRNFPLPQHGNAMTSARAAEAAGRQGKFWEMHNKIFENQDAWAEKNSSDAAVIFQDYAKNLGLDLTRFNADYNDKTIQVKILNDYKSGVNLNVQGTPTFFVNGKKINNPTSLDGFKQDLTDAGAPAITATTTKK